MSRIGLLMPALLLAVYVTAVSGGAATSLGVVLAKSTFGPQATQWQAPRSGWVLVLDYDGHGEAEGKLLLVDPEHDGVIGNLSVGYDPDLALSPDGRYIFLASVLPNGDSLSVFDARNASLVWNTTLNNRLRYTLAGSPSVLGTSADGKLAYVLKMRTVPGSGNGPRDRSRATVDVYSLAAFQWTTKNALAEARLPNCRGGQLLPLKSSEQVQVVCPDIRQLNFFRVLTNRVQAESTGLVLPLEPNTAAKSVAAVTLLPSGDTIAIMRDSYVVRIRDRKVVSRIALSPPLLGKWIDSRIPPLSPDGRRLYVTAAESDDRGLFTQIFSVDINTGQFLGVIKPTRAFSSLALSPDNRFLYATAPEDQSLLVIDANALQEVRVIHNIGSNPMRVAVVP